MDASPTFSPPSVGRPLRLAPFGGWRLSAARIGDPATARLFARPYREGSDRLDAWRASGQLLCDEPAVYVHEYTADGLTVRGLVGALDLTHRSTSPDERAVLAHEGIHPDQVAALADRMGTWALNPAPILLAHDGPEAVRRLLERTTRQPPLDELVDRADQRHRLWAVRDPTDLRLLDTALAGAQALIADGHHRYAAYLRMHDDSPGGPADHGLAMLVDQVDTPLFLGAIHRVLARTSLEQVRAALPARARYATTGMTEAFDAVAPDTLALTDGRSWATVTLRLRVDRAAVEVLHEELVPTLDLSDRSIGYHHSVVEALARVRAGRGVAVLMPAPDFDVVLRVARAGRLLPEKATSFQPKPSVGVLMRSLRDEPRRA